MAGAGVGGQRVICDQSQRPSIRLDAAAINRLLDRLDAIAAHGARVHLRSTERFAYRHPVVVEFPSVDGSRAETVIARNISRDGVGFLSGRYVYVGTRCRLRLVSEHNFAQAVDGTVVRCRYLEGTAGAHEIGVRFDEAIDVALYHREGFAVRTLLLEPNEANRAMLAAMLKRPSVEINAVGTRDQARELALKSPFELFIVSTPGLDRATCDFLRELRAVGYSAPIVTLCPANAAQLTEFCAAANCHGCQPLPLSREVLTQLTGQFQQEPLLSSFARKPEKADVINQFVHSLPTTLRELEKLLDASDAAGLSAAVFRMQVFAEAAGFEPIAAELMELGKAAEQSSPPDAHPRMARLTRLCHAARPVHTGRSAPPAGSK